MATSSRGRDYFSSTFLIETRWLCSAGLSSDAAFSNYIWIWCYQRSQQESPNHQGSDVWCLVPENLGQKRVSCGKSSWKKKAKKHTKPNSDLIVKLGGLITNDQDSTSWLLPCNTRTYPRSFIEDKLLTKNSQLPVPPKPSRYPLASGKDAQQGAYLIRKPSTSVWDMRTTVYDAQVTHWLPKQRTVKLSVNSGFMLCSGPCYSTPYIVHTHPYCCYISVHKRDLFHL